MSTPKQAQRLVDIARAEIGTREVGTSNVQKYSPQVPGLEWSQGMPWCATYVSWCAIQADIDDLFPRTASCDAGGAWFKQRGQWSEFPAVGAQIFFGTPTDLSHTGIVVSFTDTTVTSIEGNTDDNGSRNGVIVGLNTRLRRASNVVGYGHPAWAKDEAPAPVRKPRRPKDVRESLAELRQARAKAKAQGDAKQVRLIERAIQTLLKIEKK